MPYKAEKIKLSETQDRRRKLTEKQKEEIRAIYATGVCGARPLAKKFGVSRSTIQIIVNPKRAEKAKLIAEKYGLKYIPLQDKFDEAAKKAPNDYWHYDGVHPTPMGHQLIKNEWIKTFKELSK